MRVWLICVVALFGAVQLYDWVQHISIPLPVYGVAGLLLAILSNFDKLPQLQTAEPQSSPAVEGIPVAAVPPKPLAPSPILSDFSAKQASLKSDRVAKPQLPNLKPTAPSPSVSFEIRPPQS